MNNTAEGMNTGFDVLNSKVASLGSYVNASQLTRVFGISRSALFNLTKQGAFPKGIKIGRNVRWSVSDIQHWLAQQA